MAMWWPLLVLKLVSPILLSLASALLLISLFTDNWIVVTNSLGTHYENLWRYCIDSTCFSINRGWEYDLFVIGLLGIAAAHSVALPLSLLLLCICKKNSFLIKKFQQSILLPGVATMIGMSVYTGHYTYDVNYEDRGFSFWMAWASFPISIVSAFAGWCHIIFQEIEEENEIISNVIPGN